MWKPAFFGLVCSVFTGMAGTTAGARCADLSLVLAIDASSSVDAKEFDLQIQGYAAAFLDPVVLGALRSAGIVDVAAVFWADSALPGVTLGWTRIRDATDANALVKRFASVKRTEFGDTDIGSGLWRALDLLDQPGQCAARKIVNLSGDGRASAATRRNRSIMLEQARDKARSMGVTVNALAITNAEADLDIYYETNLITGPGAFVMRATDFDAFGAAIVQKLEREIRPMLAASLATSRVVH